MNESDFENELRALRPVAPTADLENRIAVALAPADRRMEHPAPHAYADLLGEWLHRLGWALCGAAAAVAVMLLLQSGTRSAPQPAPAIAALESGAEEFFPPEGESELVEADDTGIIYSEDAEPFRQMRFRSIERYAWADPDTGARVEVEVPREDVVLMPVAMQ